MTHSAALTFQSTPPVRGATGFLNQYCPMCVFQSTPPVRGATLTDMSDPEKWIRFQSTPPVRGATQRGQSIVISPTSISIHAPRAGSDPADVSDITITCPFQSTPPVRGATCRRRREEYPPSYFNPRPPCGGRHVPCFVRARRGRISIHAPRAGGDYTVYLDGVNVYISIHAPRAGGDKRQTCFKP